ncbi:ATP-dependent DNA helicase RecQ-like [Haliotis rubra]|uniref:ATP-dependent DNA helicase RecQ-like n=1 Tax=Haliotis rubra TaxID=36100 RepID=UPI001EE5A6D9|nr:ATP-dependent DNA helicase RecQ-like [Haliotis rubra]
MILSEKYYCYIIISKRRPQTFVVVDEEHCVLEWGQDFRPVFAKLGTLRALLPNAKVLALSATLSLEGQNEVAKKLGMTNYESVSMASARDNISLIIGSQDWVGRSYELAERMLGDKMYSGGLELKHTRVVQFHAPMEKTGDKVYYVQQIGRAGRSGQQSEAILFYNNSDIGRPHVSQTMKEICKNTSVCRRQQVNEAFSFSNEKNISAETGLFDNLDTDWIWRPG